MLQTTACGQLSLPRLEDLAWLIEAEYVGSQKDRTTVYQNLSPLRALPV